MNRLTGLRDTGYNLNELKAKVNYIRNKCSLTDVFSSYKSYYAMQITEDW
jgi:hypothetical protein